MCENRDNEIAALIQSNQDLEKASDDQADLNEALNQKVNFL